METRIMKVDENIVNEIQLKDYKVATMQAVVNNFLEIHMLDTNKDAIESPIFQAFSEQLLEAKLAFENAKDNLIHTVFSEETRKSLVNWTLSYFDCELIYTINNK